MNISAIRAYSEPIQKTENENLNQNGGLNKVNTSNDESKANGNNSNRTRNLITQNEREFFIKLFPESSAQLERHELFNRNGKITASGISKGIYFDGRF